MPGGRAAVGRSTPEREPGDDEGAALDRLAELIGTSVHNLVSRGERAGVREVHVREALLVGEILDLGAGERWVDLGTGGGLPGLVLAIRHPEVHWTLVDSVGKKVDAVRSFAQDLGLTNATAVQGRAEELAWESAHRGRYDGVISRALASLPTVMELSRAFLRDGGLLVAIKGPSVADELPDAERARRTLRLGPIHSVDIPDAARPTVVVTMRAQGSPPRHYPRKVGIPAAAPLGGRRT